MPSTIRNYEAMVILNPTLGEEETGTLVERLATVLRNGGAELKEIARWGKRRLAYDIEKKAEGYYAIYYFTLEEKMDVIAAFERTCRYDEQIMRCMITKVPTKKRGQEIAQLVPTPGYLADFKLEPRSHGPRRRFDHDRGGPPSASPPFTPPPAAELPAISEVQPAEEPPAEGAGE